MSLSSNEYFPYAFRTNMWGLWSYAEEAKDEELVPFLVQPIGPLDTIVVQFKTKHDMDVFKSVGIVAKCDTLTDPNMTARERALRKIRSQLDHTTKET